MGTGRWNRRLVRVVAPALGAASAMLVNAVPTAQGGASNGVGTGADAPARCRIEGRITSGGVPLPGVSIVVRARDADAVRLATSTDVDGRYAISASPDSAFRLAAELTGFTAEQRDVMLGPAPCDRTVDIVLALTRRGIASTNQQTQTPAEARVPGSARGAGGRGRPGGTFAGRGEAQQDANGFQALAVQPDTATTSVLDVNAAQETEAAARLVPSGFSVDSAQADAIAVAGNGTSIDRGSMNDRFQAITLGQFDPATGQFSPGFGPAAGVPGFAAQGGQAFGGGPGPGGPPGGGPGRGGPGFFLGGRGARGQSAYQGTVNYTFGGSALDTPPFQLRPDVPVSQPRFAKNAFGATVGGPLKIPGLYADTNRRSNFQINYTGNESNNLFDQYATVPTDAMRQGDFSAVPVQLVDPKSGLSFAGNQIPISRFDSTASALLPFIPAPNLPGSVQNYHVSTTAHTASQALSVRVTQNLSRTVQQNGRGRPGFGGFGRGGFGGRGGGGPAAARGTNVVLNAQLQYRHTTADAPNVFPALGGQTTNTSVSAPVSLLVQHGRSINNITLNLTHSAVDSSNAFANSNNIAAAAGIAYPPLASTDPLNWGVPNLTFNGFSGVRGASASTRGDNRFTAGYNWIHPLPRHQLRAGGDFRFDRSDSNVSTNPRGTFTFTGAFSAGSASVGQGADFADFLLGQPQQASLQVGGTSRLRQYAYDAFIEDNWQLRPRLTLNLGLRYELAKPYVEINGRMANLDAATDFAAISSVRPGAVGPFTGAFPAGLLNTDTNNLGPRLGLAFRASPKTIVRGGYSVTYNSGSYAAIAHELVNQPPFADTETVTETPAAQPATIAEALLGATGGTTNNWGVNKDYALGTIQTWNATLTRNLTQDWAFIAAYSGVKGTNLDILRAPDLGPSGPFISGVQPFIWESSGGRSLMNAANVQVRRRLANGISGGFSYTFARSRDNASSLGAGGPVVAQNDQNLAAEYGPSNFDRRQQFSGNFYYELPWGPNRRWLKDGGTLAGLLGEWSAQFTVTLQSGTPLTARVLGAATDLLRGVNGSLRANYNLAPIALSNPSIDEFFNVTAFSAPPAGAFGDSLRNMIVGPGAKQLDGSLQRDIRIGGNRALTLQINALNLLNTVQWASVDTNVNSPTFGHVLSVRPMRTVTVTARIRF